MPSHFSSPSGNPGDGLHVVSGTFDLFNMMFSGVVTCFCWGLCLGLFHPWSGLFRPQLGSLRPWLGRPHLWFCPLSLGFPFMLTCCSEKKKHRNLFENTGWICGLFSFRKSESGKLATVRRCAVDSLRKLEPGIVLVDDELWGLQGLQGLWGLWDCVDFRDWGDSDCGCFQSKL